MNEKPIMMRKDKLGVLRPVNSIAEQFLKSLPAGDIVRIQVSQPRNIKRHRLYWALISTTAENTEYTPDQLHDMVKIMVGHCEKLTAPNGFIWWRPKSISFSKMREPEFIEFLDRVIDKLCEILGCTPEELMTATEDAA